MHLITWINDQRCENLGTDSEVRIIPFRAGGRGAAMFGFPASTIELPSKPEAPVLRLEHTEPNATEYRSTKNERKSE